MSHKTTISSIQPSQPRKRQPHSLAFWRRLGLCWFLSLTLGGLPLMPPAAKAEVRPSAPEKPAANASTPPPAVQGNVDLSVTALDTATIVTDSQTLVISGALGAKINNLGTDAVNAAFRVIAFEDRNSNGAFDQGTDLLLGSTDFPSGVAANGSTNLSIALSGIVTFKSNLIYVWVDSQNTIAETNENNNLRNTGQNSLGTGTNAPVNLSGWQVIQYDLQDQGPASWSLESNNTVARQSLNADPSILLSDFVLASSRIEGTFRGENVPNDNDDDFIGFVFGHQDSGHYYLFDWKLGDQTHCTFGERGMSVKVVSLDSQPTCPDLWTTAGNGARVRTLFHNTIPWQLDVSYSFTLDFFPGSFTINVKQGATILATINLQDSTYQPGKFGFYNYSQAQVVYSGFSQTNLLLPDLTASLIRKNDALFPASSELIARIGNGGGASVPANTKVSFYRGDPAAGGTLIGTTQTSISLNPGQYEDVKVVWNSPPIGLHPITVVADDNGLGVGTVNEGNEANNKAMANIALGIGPFTLVDDLIARFKDSAVDLKWSPIAGASGYNIYRRTGNNSPQLIKQNHPRANYADSTVTNGTTVYYTVRWVNANGIESGDGTEMSATPTSQNSRGDVPPTILSAPVTHAIANTPYAYDVSARDPNAADALSYSLPSPISEALRGITVNPASGLIQWTPNLAGAGYQNVTVRVEDSRGRFATQTYRLFVEIPNQPPVVNAGADQTSILAAGATLNGSALDDGLPFGSTLTTAWSKVSGPGTVTFANAGTAATTAAFSTPGSYVLRLTASDSQFSRNDEVTVLVVSQLASRIYTLNSDFDAGQYDNVVHSIPHQLQLPSGNSLVPTVPLNPVVKWRKDSFSVRPDLTSVRMTPAVIDLNGDQIPDIVFVTGGYTGILRAISGADGSELWNVTDPAYLLTGDVGVAVGDIDNDGRPEIIASDVAGKAIAFEHDGTFKWRATAQTVTPACSIADLDHDGIPEIICGATVLNNNGTLRWQRPASGGYGEEYSAVVDLDLDGNPEIVSGGKAYKSDGTLLWDAGLDGQNAVGNFDADPYPEIVIVVYPSSSAYLLEHTGQVKWGPISIPSGRGGPPTIADVDGDGQPEIGIAAATAYTMFRADGSIKWQAPITDGSSAACGSTIFDLNGDGIPEVIYGDEQFLRIFRGTDGFELGRVPKSSATGAEYPVVADVNADGHAEIIAVAEGTQTGIIAIGGGDNNWRNARRLWNQYTYHVTNINDDGTIPRYEQPNWLMPGLNNFRVNTAPSVNSGIWAVTFDSQIANAEWGRLNWNAQVCGDGALTVTAASSTDNTNFSSPQTVTRGADLTVPNGRYLRVSVSFRRATTGESPVLYDLSVGTDGYMPQALANTAPVVDAGASQLIALPNPARLLPSVCDDTQPVNGTLASTWSKFSGPGTVTFANANALVTTATFSAAGTYVLRLTVNDGQFSISDDITIEVENNNRPPVIASQPVMNGYVGRPYAYQVIATDPNSGDVLSYSLPTAPAGMGINPITGLIQWTPVIGQIGNHNVRVVVTDAAGAFAEQLYTVTVTDPPPNQPPVIASTAPTGAAVEVPYTYAVIATDPDAGDVLTYSLDAAPAGMTINAATGLIQWFPLAAQVGNHNVTVRVRDVSNATVTQSFTIAVIATVLEPTVAITSPAPGSNVTQLVNIVGDVTDPNNGAGPPLTWTLAYRRHDSTTYKTIGSGTGPVSNATVGQFDPTLLANDVYYIRLQATKGIHIIGTEAPYNVMGDLKLGNFTVSFTDLTIPVAGIPIVITRSYDSLDTDTGEFGAGWRLGLAGKVRDTAREGVGDTFNTSTRVYVTRADGRRVGFTFAPEHIGGFFPMWRPVFRPDPGVTETLEVPDAYLFNSGGQFFDGFDVYNPDLYTFVTKEGVRYTIDEIQGLKKVTDTNGNTLTVTPTGITSSTGISVAFERDAQNRITKITEPAPAVGTPGELRYVYDANGNLTQFLDQMGNATKYSYAYAQFPNYLTKIEDPLNRAIARNVFDNQGRLIGLCDANGDINTLNGCMSVNFDVAGKLETSFNARGFRTDLMFDSQGNVLTERRWADGANFVEIIRTYDTNGNLLTETDPAGNVASLAYDSRGNITSFTKDGRTRTYSYNSCNQITQFRDHVNKLTTYQYDISGSNLRFVIDESGQVVEYLYNARGQVTDQFDSTRNHWRQEYDAFGFPSRKTDPSGKVSISLFNVAGELEFQTDAQGRRIDFTYNSAHKLTLETWNTASPRVIEYQYSSAGQLTRASDINNTVQISYDPRGLPQRIETAGPASTPTTAITYTYDNNGNVSRVEDSHGGRTEYVYDGLDRLLRASQSGVGVREKRAEFTYDDSSLLREIRRFGSLTGPSIAAKTIFDFECAGCSDKLSAIHHRRGDNTVIHDQTLIRDSLNNITGITDAEGTHNFSYDVRHQLTAVDHPAGPLPDEVYGYDAVGNRLFSHLSSSYDYADGANRLTADEQFTYAYNDNGSVIEKRTRASGERFEYEYDHRNRLIEVRKLTVNGASLGVTRYFYDALNRRTKIEENGQIEYFVFDGLNPVLKLNSVGVVSNRRFYTRALDDILADETNNVTRWFLKDQVGTVRDLVADDGNVITHYIYDSFGRLLQQSNPAVSNEILFISRELSFATGLYYLRARYYDPGNGRFLSQDPLGFAGGDDNLYRYVFNSPIQLLDPTGTIAIFEYAQIQARLATARAAIVECLGKAAFTNLAEAGVYLLFTEVAGGFNAYAGKTVNFAVRFYQHKSGGIGGRGLDSFSQIPIQLSEEIVNDPKKLRTAEQLLLNAFGGKAELLNIRNASRQLFCN